MASSPLRRLLIHGPGRAGTALALRLVQAGHPAPVFTGGSAGSRRSAVELVGEATIGGDEARPPQAGELLLLAVPDGMIATEVERLAGCPSSTHGRVAHLAGIFGRSVLRPLQTLGYDTAAFHPLCSIPERSASHVISGSVIGMDVDPHQAPFWEELAVSVGGAPVHIPEHARASYHLAASVMGNAVQALADLSYRALGSVGLDSEDLRSGLLHLMTTALVGSLKQDPHMVMTGPVARGDFTTLRAHRMALATHEDRQFYEQLVAAQLRLIRRRVPAPDFLDGFETQWTEDTH